MAALQTILALVFGFIGFYVLQQLLAPSKKLPPGPKGVPLLGNIADLPRDGKQEWIHWLQYKDIYGPIASFTVLGQTIVLLHSYQAAFDLLEKRSAIYSSRPRLEFNDRWINFGRYLVVAPYGDRLRAIRKTMFSVIGTKVAVDKFSELQDVEARRFVLRMLREPEEMVNNVRKETGSIILKLAYGYNTEPNAEDPLVALADRAVQRFVEAAVPGKWMVDIIPALGLLPEWFPGTGWKRTAREWRVDVDQMGEVPYEFARQEIASGKNEPSFVSEHLEKKGGSMSPEDDEILLASAGSLYAGGADTTVSSILSFFMAMALFPEVQKKAQEELDRVLGSTRFPTSEDRNNLPYINALIKEVLRWHPIAPMGVPHLSTEDDVYEGHLIPKGTMILQNIWWFTHNPSIYKDPMVFNPDRFLGSEPELDPGQLSFGFGRRACPGRYLADGSLYSTVSHVLATLDIKAGLDEQGNRLEIKPEFESGVISHPKPFKVDIKARSKAAEELARNVEFTYPWKPSQSKQVSSKIA